MTFTQEKKKTVFEEVKNLKTKDQVQEVAFLLAELQS